MDSVTRKNKFLKVCVCCRHHYNIALELIWQWVISVGLGVVPVAIYAVGKVRVIQAREDRLRCLFFSTKANGQGNGFW